MEEKEQKEKKRIFANIATGEIIEQKIEEAKPEKKDFNEKESTDLKAQLLQKTESLVEKIEGKQKDKENAGSDEVKRAGEKEKNEQALTGKIEAQTKTEPRVEINSVEKIPVNEISDESYSIETAADNILDMVKKEGSISLDAIASKLKLPINIVEDIAKVLDSNGLLRLYYPAVGSGELMVKNFHKSKTKNNTLVLVLLVFIILATITFIVLKFLLNVL